MMMMMMVVVMVMMMMIIIITVSVEPSHRRNCTWRRRSATNLQQVNVR